MKIGVFGSAVNPVTLGHMDAIEQALEVCDKVLLVPSFSHAFGKDMKPFTFRCDLAELAVKECFGDRVTVSRLEEKLFDGAPIYTWKLMSALAEQYPSDQLVFLCGQDNIDNFSAFDRSEYILDNWEVVGLKERKVIRSTLVRNAVAAGECIKRFVPSSVIKQINENY